jgi:hypothetical protein
MQEEQRGGEALTLNGGKNGLEGSRRRWRVEETNKEEGKRSRSAAAERLLTRAAGS